MVQVIEALDMGDDVLLVRGTIEGLYVKDDTGADTDELVVIEAQGWLSAIEGHVDEPQTEGEPSTGHTTRPMEDDERLAYCKRLLMERYGTEATPEPRSLGISG